ncbi:MAG: hypothetical protein EA359_02625 [Balneolaceae bacterium]|nr:MAG: hypothetical protein EA359_02625 [Balneolaceae bacterium]
MKFFNYTKLSLFITILFTVFFITACGSDHDHGPTPVGLVLSLDGVEIAMQEEGTITYVDNGTHIEVPNGGALGPITVQFIQENGERYFPDTNEGFLLQYNVQNPNILGIQHPVNNNQWTFNLQGLNAGSATFNLELWHVDHSDFDSRNFQVLVSAGDN